MEYSTNFISDFASRTLRNLDHIQQAEDAEEDVYAVTQLWNSLLGLIVMPKELDFKKIPATPIADLRAKGWPLVSELEGGSKTLRDLVRNLRNAVAHANVEFTANNEDRQIASLRLWNLPSRSRDQLVRKPNWIAVIAASDLDQLARLIAATYVEAFASA